jgi:hypothetical protein
VQNPPSQFKKSIASMRPKADSGNPDVTFHQMARVAGLDNMRLIVAIAQRGAAMAKASRLARNAQDEVIEPNPEIVQADILVCHYWRKLDLRAFLTTNDLDFMAELSTIFTHIQRPLVFFPQAARLRFASSGATLIN